MEELHFSKVTVVWMGGKFIGKTVQRKSVLAAMY
jgi:hypothetical protein